MFPFVEFEIETEMFDFHSVMWIKTPVAPVP